MLRRIKQNFFCWKFFCLVVLFLVIFSFDDCYALVGKTGKNYDFRVVGLNVGNFSIGKSGTAQGTEGLSNDLKKFFVDEDADIYMLSEWDYYFNASKGIKSLDEFSADLKEHNYYIMSNCGFGLKNKESYMAQINIIKKRSGFEVNDYCSINDHSVGKLRGFVVNRVNVNGRIVHFITVHFSFDSVDNRKKQFNEVVKYIKDNGVTYFVIAGDMNLGLGGAKTDNKALRTINDVDMFNKVGYISAQGNKIIKEVFDFKNEVCTDHKCEKSTNGCVVKNSRCRFYEYSKNGKMYYFLATGGPHSYYDNVILSNNLEFTYVYYAGKRSESGIENRKSGVLSDHLAIVADISFKSSATLSNNTTTVTSSLSKDEYRVSFNGNGSTSGSTNSVVCKKDVKCRLTSNAYTRTGYKFVGWSKKANSNGKVTYSNGSEVKNLTSDNSIVLYAVWEKNKIHINYYVAGGDIRKSTTSKDGITYMWSTDSNGLIFRNNQNYAIKSYGDTIEKGLVNWNNASGVYITNGKKVAASNAEWCTEPNGGGVCYDQDEKLVKIGTNDGKDRLCDARKGDCSIKLYVNWVNPRVIVRYFPNGGSVDLNKWIVTSNGIRLKSKQDKELTTFDFGTSNLKNGLVNYNTDYLNIVREGYTAVKDKEWCTKEEKGKESKCFSQKRFDTSIYNLCDSDEKDCEIDLYVNWRPTKIYFRLNKGDGKLKEETISADGVHYKWSVDADGFLMVNGKYWKNDGVIYGDNVNLPNYNNSKFLKVTSASNIAASDREWCTEPNGGGKCFSQKKDYYGAGKNYFYDVCDNNSNPKIKDCTVKLYLNWIPRPFTVSYDSNGGSGLMSSHLCELDKDCLLKKSGFSLVGYSFVGWKKDNSGSLLLTGDNVKNAGEAGAEVKYYAQWTPNKVIIRYHSNGGRIVGDNFIETSSGIRRKNRQDEEVQVIEYGEKTTGGGLMNYDNAGAINIKRVGYSAAVGKEWCTNENGTGRCFDQGNRKISALELCDKIGEQDCTLDLYVNWVKK